MGLSLGFANYDDRDSGAGVWGDVLQVEARRYFARKSYGARVRDITIVWSGLGGGGASRTLIRGVGLVIRPRIEPARVLLRVEPEKRLEYLANVTLERVREHTPYLVKKGFDAGRFLSDLTRFFRVVLPKRIARSGSEPDVLFDELDELVELMESGRPIERVKHSRVAPRTARTRARARR